MITVKMEGFGAVKARLAGMAKQVNFAASKALNATAKRVVEAMPAEMEKALDRPTPFTKKGVAVLERADKSRLQVTVGFRKIQAEYMQWQVSGGSRSPGEAGLKLPSAIKLNDYGNIPKGVIAGLMALARKDKGAKKAAARRVRVSAKLELYYGDPVDKTGKLWPRGIYKIANGSLIPLIVFPKVSARYRVRFDFKGKAKSVVDRVWRQEFDKALADALSTAR